MDYLCLLIIVVQHVSARISDSIPIVSAVDCRSRNFVPTRQTYTFLGIKIFDCNIPITIPSAYSKRQYCIEVKSVHIPKTCPVELRIYEGLTSYKNTPKVTLTCDSLTTEGPICISGSGNGIFIQYNVYSVSYVSEIVLQIDHSDIPRTTTVITLSDYEDENEVSTLLPLLSIIAVIILISLCIYYCCCKKPQNGTVLRPPDNQVVADPTSNDHTVQPSAPPEYTESPPSYARLTSDRLIQPSAPPLEADTQPYHSMISDDPPPYESVVRNSGQLY